MKKKKTLLKTQRRSLDEKLRAVFGLRALIPPKAGWIKAIRESLGMTTAQMAERMGIHQSGVTMLEQREVQGTVTLETLRKAAQALNCEVVYVLLPKESLEKTVDEQARRAAQQILKRTLHTMKLESQESEQALDQLHEDELAQQLKDTLAKNLWSPHE